MQRIVYAEQRGELLPACQTGGRLLADRALSRLLQGRLAADARRARGQTGPAPNGLVSRFAAVSRNARYEGNPGARRWAVFNAVGILGAAVQLTVLAALTHGGRLPYLAATALAVETAVLHNFMWHQRWTWRDRRLDSRRQVIDRLIRFHLLNGRVSIVGDLILTALLTGGLGVRSGRQPT